MNRYRQADSVRVNYDDYLICRDCSRPGIVVLVALDQLALHEYWHEFPQDRV